MSSTPINRSAAHEADRTVVEVGPSATNPDKIRLDLYKRGHKFVVMDAAETDALIAALQQARQGGAR